MAAPTLATLLRGMTGQDLDPPLAQVSLAVLDLAPGESPPFGTEALAFQGWPDKLADARSAEWSQRKVPGLSHPLMQWTAGEGRSLSWTAVFTTDLDPAQLGPGRFPTSDYNDPYAGTIGLDRRQVLDPRAAVQWLRYFTYPYYPQNGVRVFPPPKLLLVAEGLHLGVALNEDAIHVVLTKADVLYEQCFPSGFPRIVVMDLAFEETIQHGGRVVPIGRNNGATGSFALSGRYPLKARTR